MKKTLLFSIVLFVSVASFAQTSVKSNSDVKNKTTVQSNKNGSDVNHSGSASSTTSIQSNDVKNAENKSREGIKKGKKTVASKKADASAEANAKGEAVSEMSSSTSSNAKMDASGQSSTTVDLSKTDNNLSEKTSINGNGAISTEGILSNENQLNSDGKILVKTTTSEVIESGTKAETKLNKKVMRAEKKISKSGSASVNAGGATSNSIQIKPVSVKTGANIKTNTGIKIK